MKKIAILFSGEGSNLENLIKILHKKRVIVASAITNNPHANGIQRARKYDIDVKVIDHKLYKRREDFDRELVKTIKGLEVDLVVLAGFMRILTPIFVNSVDAINIHPSLLPLFKGADAIKESFNSSMKVAGVTVHRVSLEVDDGEIIKQICFDRSDMSFDEFKEQIHRCEHKIFPEAVIEILEER